MEARHKDTTENEPGTGTATARSRNYRRISGYRRGRARKAAVLGWEFAHAETDAS